MKISKNTKKGALAVIGSLGGLMVAKWCNKTDVYPYVIVGGFLGNFIGEEYIEDDHQWVALPIKKEEEK